MTPADIHVHIGRYIESLGGGEAAWVAALVKHWGKAAVATALIEMLESRDGELMAGAALFAGDLYWTDRVLERYLATAGLGRLAGRLLTAEHMGQRGAAMSLLSSSRALGARRYLREALPWFLESRPIEVRGVLMALDWRDRKHERARDRQVLAARSFVSRWAIFASVDYGGDRSRSGRRYARVCRALLRDEHPSVRAEARHRLDVHRELLGIRGRGEDRWRVMAEIASRGPRVSFHDVWLGFHHWCAHAAVIDYDARTAEAFADHCSVRTLREHLASSTGSVEDAMAEYFRGFLPPA